MLNSHIRQYICKNTKNIQKSDFMDGKTEILNDLNDLDLHDRKRPLSSEIMR